MLVGLPLIIAIFASIVIVVLMCTRYRVNPFVALIVVSVGLGIGVGMPLPEVGAAIQSGFGGLMRYIGLIVVFGSIIGVFLERSGGAMRIAAWILERTGKQRSLAALSVVGAVVSIPVFCDSGFILLSGLTDRLSRLAKENKASMSLALATGLYTTHTLVPPTPGPIAVAGNLGATDYLGTVILVGMCISIPVLFISQYAARKLGGKIKLEVQSEDIVVQEQLPSLWRAFVPLLLPVVLIAVGTILPFVGIESRAIQFVGSPLIALLIGAVAAMFLLAPTGAGEVNAYILEAIKVAGPILIITGAGGAFGGVLKATPLGDTVGTWIGTGVEVEVVALILVFAIAAVLKTAQGSSTSAMVITSALLAPLVPILGWSTPMDFALAVMAIGGGAMVVSHYNDSYFWVVSQFGGLSDRQAFRSFSAITGIMGLSVLLITLALSLIF